MGMCILAYACLVSCIVCVIFDFCMLYNIYIYIYIHIYANLGACDLRITQNKALFSAAKNTETIDVGARGSFFSTGSV